MKALSIRQPWAWLIVTGQKLVENRVWPTHYRGPLLIHAGARPDREPIASIEHRLFVKVPRDKLQFGGIIGEVELVDCVTSSGDRFFVGPYGFVLANPRPLRFTPLRGLLKLFDVPPDVVRAARR